MGGFIQVIGSTKRKYGNDIYKKHYAQLNSDITFQPEYDEFALVSLDALTYAFALCGAVLCVGVVSFMVEWRAIIAKGCERAKVIVGDFLIRKVEGFRGIWVCLSLERKNSSVHIFRNDHVHKLCSKLKNKNNSMT